MVRMSWVPLLTGISITSVLCLTGCDKTSKLSNPQKWALAVSAIPKKAGGMDLDILGGGEADSDYIETLKNMLKRDWDIQDRAGAQKCLKDLKEEGHRKRFSDMAKDVTPLDAQAFETVLSKIPNQPEVQAQLQFVRKHSAPLGAKGIIGWDLCRVIYLAECCARAGFITEEEAWREIMPTAKLVQTTFSSWEDMSANYLLGREFWSGTNNPRILAAERTLRSDKNSPWVRLPWNLPLEITPGKP